MSSSPPADRARCAIRVPREAVGFIIGRRGETVRSLSTRSGAHIAVEEDNKDHHDEGVFNITGTQEQIQRARELISEKVNAVLFHPPNPAAHLPLLATSPTTRDPSAHSSTPRATSPRASSSSTPPIQLPPRPPNSNPDEPTGSPIATTEDPAHSTRDSNGHTQILPSLIERDFDPSSPEQAEHRVTPVPVFGPSFRPLEMWIPRNMVGMIIGLNGQVIGDMQDKTGATIVVHNQRKRQDGSKLLTISGTPEVQQEAKRLIDEILSSDPRPRGSPGASGSRRSRRDRAPSGIGLRQIAPPLPPQIQHSEQFVPQGEPIVPQQPYGENFPPTDSRTAHFNPNVGNPPFPIFRQPSDRQPMPPNTRIPLPHPGPPSRPPFFEQLPTPPFVQRGPYNTPPYFMPHPVPPAQYVKRVKVPTSCVGIVIGKGGETIRDLQKRSGAYIKVTPDREANENDEERNIFISGSNEAIDLAHNLLNDIVNEGLRRSYRDGVGQGDNLGGPAGAGKEEELGPESGTARTRPHTAPSPSQEPDTDAPGQPEGDNNDEEKVEPKEVSLSIEGDYSIVRQPETEYPSSSIMVELSIPNAKVGVIIGKGGQTIRELQQQSGARIVISKMMDTTREDNPRQVTITGPVPFVEKAYNLIHAKIRGDVSAELPERTPDRKRLQPDAHDISQGRLQVPPEHYQPPTGPIMPIRGTYPEHPPLPFLRHSIAEMQEMGNRFAQQQHAFQIYQQQQQQQHDLMQRYHHQLSIQRMHPSPMYVGPFGVHPAPFHTPPQVQSPYLRDPSMDLPRTPPLLPIARFAASEQSGGVEATGIEAGTQMATQPVQERQDPGSGLAVHERVVHQGAPVPFPGFFPGQYTMGFHGASPHQFPTVPNVPSEAARGPIDGGAGAGTGRPAAGASSAAVSEAQAESQAAAGSHEEGGGDGEKRDSGDEHDKS